jgi:hypothetical protein
MIGINLISKRGCRDVMDPFDVMFLQIANRNFFTFENVDVLTISSQCTYTCIY